MWVKNGPHCVLMKNPKNERFRRQVNPLTPMLGLTLLVVCPEVPLEELKRLGGRSGDWSQTPKHLQGTRLGFPIQGAKYSLSENIFRKDAHNI